MSDIELQEIGGSTTYIPPSHIISKLSLYGVKIDENGRVTAGATVSGNSGGVDIHGLDVYVDDSFTYMWTPDKYDSGCLFKYYSSTAYINDIGIANAKYTGDRLGKSINIQIKSNYSGAGVGEVNVVSSTVYSLYIPTSSDLATEFIAYRDYSESEDAFIFEIKPSGQNYSNSYKTYGTYYYTIDGSDPSDSNNSNRKTIVDNTGIIVPNKAGSYEIRVWHKVGAATAELESLTYTVGEAKYTAPTISYDNINNLIKFSNLDQNKDTDVLLQVQYEIVYNVNSLTASDKINIDGYSERTYSPAYSGKVRARIVDSRGVPYGASEWSDYFTYTKLTEKYPLPPVNVDNKTNTISFSEIPKNVYLHIHFYYNDGTEEIKNYLETTDGIYKITYTKNGYFTYIINNKLGAEIGTSDTSSPVYFTVVGSSVEIYPTPNLKISTTTNNAIEIYNILKGYELDWEISYDYDNDGTYDKTESYNETTTYTSKIINIGKYKGKIRARIINSNGEAVGYSEWSSWLEFDFTDSTPDPEPDPDPEVKIKIPNITTEEVKVNNITKIKVLFTRPSSETNLYTKVYYTINGIVPNTDSNLANINEEFYITPPSNNFNIRYRAYYEINDKTYWSDTGSVNISVSDNPNPEPDPEPGGDNNKDNINNPFHYGYNKPSLNTRVVKNYIDIIFSVDPESTKSLEAIQYVLDEIIKPFGTINLAEQVFARKYNNNNKRFSGDKLVLYSDETYSGELNINDNGDVNKMNNYKLPTFQKGHWEFNYFRNKLANKFTKEELQKVYTNIPITKADGTTEIVSITVEDLINSISTTNKNNINVFRSDNRSLIYGKYIVARFIFNNDKRIKLQNVTFITNNY